jgi:hypothetical protein
MVPEDHEKDRRDIDEFGNEIIEQKIDLDTINLGLKFSKIYSTI